MRTATVGLNPGDNEEEVMQRRKNMLEI